MILSFKESSDRIVAINFGVRSVLFGSLFFPPLPPTLLSQMHLIRLCEDRVEKARTWLILKFACLPVFAARESELNDVGSRKEESKADCHSTKLPGIVASHRVASSFPSFCKQQQQHHFSELFFISEKRAHPARAHAALSAGEARKFNKFAPNSLVREWQNEPNERNTRRACTNEMVPLHADARWVLHRVPRNSIEKQSVYANLPRFDASACGLTLT